jgi:hypothetical protein
MGNERGYGSSRVFYLQRKIMPVRAKPPKQSESELKAMAEFYGSQYPEVYFVRCLKNNHVIAVEVAPAQQKHATIDRESGSRNIFGYQDQFFTTRRRLDVNDNRHKMVGYECACGNDTRLSAFEKGVVPERKMVVAKGSKQIVKADPPLRSLSPFERSQLESQVRISQASARKKANYGSYVDKDGRPVERFESFEVVRVK